jgi:hypothetical protein
MATRRYRSRALLSAGCLAAAASLAIAASGAGQPAAGAQLQAAWRSLSSSPQVTFSLHLDATASELEALPGHPSADNARLAAGGSVVVEAATTSGKPLSSLEHFSGSLQQYLQAEELSVVGELDGSPLVELQVVGGVLYAELNVAGLDSVLAGSGQSLATAEADLPAKVVANPAVAALFAGKWVSVDLVSLVSELRSAGLLPSSQSAGARSRAQARQIIDALTQTFTKEVSVASVGTSAQLGTDLLLSTNLHDFATELLSSLSRVAPRLVTSKDVSRAAQVPNRSLQVHAYVAGGTLTQVSVDLSQLASGGRLPAGTQLPLVLNVSHAPVTITAPSGAVALDVPTLIQEAESSPG